MDAKKIGSGWSCFDTLTVWQAASLIQGLDPNLVDYLSDEVPNSVGDLNSNEHAHVKTIALALIQSIKAGKLEATVVRDGRLGREFEFPSKGEGQWDISNMSGSRLFYKKAPNWEKTTIDVSDLKNWLLGRSLRPAFFFPDEKAEKSIDNFDERLPEFLDKNHPRYAPKLAAAVSAWCAVTTPKKMSPKKALENWLRANAGHFRLVDAQGTPVKTAIEECSKVANWNGFGGATKSQG